MTPQQRYRLRNLELCRQRVRDHYRRNIEAQRARWKLVKRKAFKLRRASVLAYNRRWSKAHTQTILVRDFRRQARRKKLILGDFRLIAKWFRATLLKV